MPDPKMVNIVHPDAPDKTYSIPESDVADAIAQGYSVESGDRAITRVERGVQEKTYGGVGGKVLATGAGVARSLSGGASDAVISLLGGREHLQGLREVNPLTSTIAEVGGSVLPIGVPGVAGRLAARAGRAAEGAGTLRQIAAAAKGAGTEGVVAGVGSGVSELALSDDPLSIERAASVLGSHALFGAATGGALGAAGKVAEKGLLRAKSALDRVAKGADAGVDAATADIATLDRKGLRAAEKAELDAIEAARVPKRAELADEIKALRSEMKEQKIWLATKDADVKELKEIREVAKTALEADKSIDRMLRNPKALASRPQRVLDGLQQQEHALERLVGQTDNLKPIFAKDASGARQTALDYASTALQKNRALQAKIGELTGKASSPRLDAIADRMAGVSTPAAGGMGDAIGDAALGYAVGAAAGVPVLGQVIAAARVGMGVVRKLGLDSAANAARGSKAIQAFVDVGSKVARPVPVLASKALASARFGEAVEQDKTSKKATLADSFKARSSEIRQLTVPGPDGAPVMRPEARAKLAARLAPVRAVSPIIADRIETAKARAVEFLAGKLPRKPDLPGMGPHDGWQPSDMEMRGWARYVAAVEDPDGIVERLASGEVTPEDAETMREVYPEMYAQIQAEIMGKLGELRAKLPYQRRLALSIFSGVPVDPALDPRVLAALQGTFAAEQGTEAGTMAPRAQPAFGSVTKPEPTPAQQRGA